MNQLLSPTREMTPGRQARAESAAAAAPTVDLLLRVFLDETLTANDRRWLDDLFPDHCLTFMVRDGAWMHPDDLPLFDFSTLDSLIAQCGPAIMTHQYHPDRHDAELYSVQTAIVNPDDQPTLVFGMLGPHQFRRDSQLSARFESIVDRLRRDWQRMRPAFVRIYEAFRQANPVVVVAAGSQQILAANRSARWPLHRNQLTGAGIAAISELLAGPTKTTRLECGDMEVSLIALEAAATELSHVEPSPEELRSGADQAMRELNDAVAQLLSLTRTSEDGLVRGIIHTIHRQTEVLRGRLNKLTSTPAGVDPTHGIENGHTD